MFPPVPLKALSVGGVPVLILIFVLSCQGLPAHSEEHGCQPVIAVEPGGSLMTSLDAPVVVCSTLTAGPVLRPLGWERPWLIPIARAQDPPSPLLPRAPPSLFV
jgi:hypothetical protein